MIALDPTRMTDSTPKSLPEPVTMEANYDDRLLSDEPTIELVIRGRDGDRMAVEALLQRCVPYIR